MGRAAKWKVFVASLLLLSAVGNAQYRLILSLPEISEYPKIKVPLQILDNSATIEDLTEQNFVVRENGVVQFPITLDCQTEVVPDTIHFMFVMDVSLSMAFKEGTREWDRIDSVKWRKAKKVITEAFYKIRPHDPAALLTFGERSVLDQDFTVDKKLLADVVDALRLRSGTAIYDAIIEAVNICSAQKGKKVIILQTDGSDQTGQTPNAAIAAARAAGIPVYIIGLGVEPTDEPTLKYIAKSTGGEFFLAPTSAQLEDVFTRIINSILSRRCILTYTTSDTCRTGSRRDVEVTVDIRGDIITETTYYETPDLQSRLTMFADPDPGLPNESEVDIPVKVTGELRPDELTNLDFILTFNQDVMDFVGIVTPTFLLDGQTIQTSVVEPGKLRVFATEVLPSSGVPYGAEGTLFAVRFRIKYQSKMQPVRFEIQNPSITQNCFVYATGSTNVATVLGCPAQIRVAIDSLFVVKSGTTFRIPLILRDGVDIRQDFRYSLRILYDHTLITYAGFDQLSSISSKMPVTVIEPVPGELLITGLNGRPADSIGVLLYLIFHSSEQLSSHVVPFQLRDPSFSQSCNPKALAEGERIFLDGICEAILTRKPGFKLLQNVPNPFSLNINPTTQIEFSVLGEAPSRLEVLDLNGRVVAVLFDGQLTAGSYTVSFTPSALPGGVYVYMLREGNNIATKTMIWSK